MRARLTVAIVLLVAATIVLTSLVSALLVREATRSATQRELTAQGQAIARTVAAGTAATGVGFRKELSVVRQAGDFTHVAVLVLHSDGTITGTLPPGVSLDQLHLSRLEAGEQVSGKTSDGEVFTAVPTVPPSVTRFTPIVVLTRDVPDSSGGFRSFGLIGILVLVAAALVAAALARRFTRPLVATTGVTQRIAEGDLDARVELPAHVEAEFTRLADSINTMDANLARARDQERQFLLSVSHELRTPLTSIRGYSDAILDGATDDYVAASAVIATEAARLERLVEDLLDLARLDARRFSLQLGPVDLAELATQRVEGFRPEADRRSCALTLTTSAPSPCWVHGDPDRLGQILANLIENALSFATSVVLVDLTLTGSDHVTIRVSDDGPGIAPDRLLQVFERHFTSDRSSGRRKGSGLGLAIVAELTAAMGGTAQAHSPAISSMPGDLPGTTLEVTLPWADQRAMPSQ